MVAQDHLPRLLCRDCRDVIAALSETYDAAMFAEDISRRVGFGRKIRARDGRVVWFAGHDKSLKRLDGPQNWRSRRAGWYTPHKRCIRDSAMTGACSAAFSVGVEHVDHRLRQILIPKEGAEGGYVSMTPMTAGGICELLFEKDNGLVPRPNVACEEEGKRIGRCV